MLFAYARTLKKKRTMEGVKDWSKAEKHTKKFSKYFENKY